MKNIKTIFYKDSNFTIKINDNDYLNKKLILIDNKEKGEVTFTDFSELIFYIEKHYSVYDKMYLLEKGKIRTENNIKQLEIIKETEILEHKKKIEKLENEILNIENNIKILFKNSESLNLNRLNFMLNSETLENRNNISYQKDKLFMIENSKKQIENIEKEIEILKEKKHTMENDLKLLKRREWPYVMYKLRNLFKHRDRLPNKKDYLELIEINVRMNVWDYKWIKIEEELTKEYGVRSNINSKILKI